MVGMLPSFCRGSGRFTSLSQDFEMENGEQGKIDIAQAKHFQKAFYSVAL